MKLHTLKYLLCVSLLLSFTCTFTDNSYARDAIVGADEYTSNDLQSAQFALNSFLKALELNQFKKCKEFFSEKLLRTIKKDADSCEHFLKASEEFYRKPRILDNKAMDGEYVFKVKMGIDGPGYKSCAITAYHMIFQRGKWKIKEWKIESTEEIPINVDSAVYCYK